jgi:CDP-paratose 2-epimerase
MKYLITGACGLVGSSLASEALARGHELIAFDNLSRVGTEMNLAWLKSLGSFQWIHGDVRNISDVESAIRDARPDCIFHLAGQVAMTTSVQDPRSDFEANTLGTINVLETIRRFSPYTGILYSSTNKVYGDLTQFHYDETSTRYTCREHPNGFDESLPLDFCSPYGCSKGAADQYILDYHRTHGINSALFRHSSIFGVRQHATIDQGWVGWFVKQALETKKNSETEFTVSGSGKQVRDVLFAGDLIDCYFRAADSLAQISGQAFNIGGGVANSLSLLELFAFLEKYLEVKLKFTQLPWRKSDQKVFVAQNKKATDLFGWSPSTNVTSGLEKVVQWTRSQIPN